MRRAHSSNPNQKHTLELTLIDNKIDTNCLKNKSLIFLFIFVSKYTLPLSSLLFRPRRFPAEQVPVIGYTHGVSPCPPTFNL